MDQQTINQANEYEEYLNELGIPEADKRTNGGRIPEWYEYGTWLRQHDTIAFWVGMQEHDFKPKTPAK